MSAELVSSSPVGSSETRLRLRKYFLDKLDSYAAKSSLWQIFHASHIHRNLMRKSRHLSKIHSISEDIVRQCISQLLNDLDEYIRQLNDFFSSHKFDQLFSAFEHKEKNPSGWHQIQLQRARQLFPSSSSSPLSDEDLLDLYYKHVEEKYRPQPRPSASSPSPSRPTSIEQLNETFAVDQSKARDYLTNFFKRTSKEKSAVNLDLLDQMIKLGLTDMKRIPRGVDLSEMNSFLGRLSLFHRAKDAYRCVLDCTTEDFLLLRFGRFLSARSSSSSSSSTSLFRKEFVHLLHSFLKSVITLFALLTTNSTDVILTLISKLNSFVYPDEDVPSSRLSFDLLSPSSHVDQWTWLFEQWRDVLRTMPLFLTESGSFTRLVRTTIGIGLMHLGQLAEQLAEGRSSSSPSSPSSLTSDQMNEALFRSLQIGFYFGISYAVVDSLQDQLSQFDWTSLKDFLQLNSTTESLNSKELIDHYLIRVEESLVRKEFRETDFPSTPFSQMLVRSFSNLRLLVDDNGRHGDDDDVSFFELALLLRAQRFDQRFFDDTFTDHDFFLGSALKSHYTYRCASHLGEMPSARTESERIWSIPFLGQLTDDCRDYLDDVKANCFTPFTFYAHWVEKKKTSPSVANPLVTFLQLCSDLFVSSGREERTGAFLGRRILRALNAIEVGGGHDAFRHFVGLFARDDRSLHDYLLVKVCRHFPSVTDPEKHFFRSLDQLAAHFSLTNRKLETFLFENLSSVEGALPIRSIDPSSLFQRDEEILLAAMNYSVQAGGKRLRMLLLLIVGQLYGIARERILPLACGIEYLHTSSLIFDDLPAQDNSSMRRGRATLHCTTVNEEISPALCEARAQLAAVDLISISMKTINDGLTEQGFPAVQISRVIGEIAQLMHFLCVGQMMDLCAAKKHRRSSSITLDELDRIAWLKTGKTIEAVLVAPALLSSLHTDRLDDNLARLREISRLMGILFQMRDDLLDLESTEVSGKPKALDLDNETTTYLSLLGPDATQLRLDQMLRQTLKLVDLSWSTNAETLKDLIRHIVNRKS